MRSRVPTPVFAQIGAQQHGSPALRFQNGATGGDAAIV